MRNLGIIYSVFIIANNAVEFLFLDNQQSVGAASQIQDVIRDIIVIRNNIVFRNIKIL